MKVFIDIHALLVNFFINKWLARISNTKIECLPYNPSAIHMLHNNFKSFHIVVLAPNNLEEEARKACDHLSLFDLNVSYKCFDNYSVKKQTVENYDYITSSFEPLLKYTKSFSIIGNIFSFLRFYFYPNRNLIRWNALNGMISVFWSFFQIFMPIFIFWPSLFAPHEVLNTTRLLMSFYSCLNTIFLSSMLRTLLELQNERNAYLQGYEPLCGQSFIKTSNSLIWPIIYICGSFVLAIFMAFISPYTILVTTIIGTANFFSLLMPFLVRYLFLGTAMLIVNIICQWKFLFWIFK